MVKRPDTNAQRQKRHTRVRGKVSGTSERPRLNVFRSGTNIYAQIIDDTKGVTLVSASSLEKGFEGAGNNCEAAAKVGEAIGRACQGQGHRHCGLRPRRLPVPRPCEGPGRGRP